MMSGKISCVGFLPKQRQHDRNQHEQREERIHDQPTLFPRLDVRLVDRFLNGCAATKTNQRLLGDFSSTLAALHRRYGPELYDTIPRMIPLRDVIPSRTFPFFTVVFIVA